MEHGPSAGTSAKQSTLPARFVIAVTVGGVVGLGILRGPGEIAALVPDPGHYLALWFLAGLFILLSNERSPRDKTQ